MPKLCRSPPGTTERPRGMFTKSASSPFQDRPALVSMICGKSCAGDGIIVCLVSAFYLKEEYY
jgi:hypothetical protein